MRHYAAALKEFGEARSGVKLFGQQFSHPWTVDIMVSYAGEEVAIEYDGAYWHEDKVHQDTAKSKELLSAGYAVVRLREDDLPSLPIINKRYYEVRVYSQAERPKEVMSEVKSIIDKG